MGEKNHVLSRLFEIAAQGKWKMIFSCVSMSLDTLAGMAPYLSVYFISRDLLISSGSSQEIQKTIILWATIAALSVILNTVLSFAGSFMAHRAAYQLLYGIRIRVMGHIGRLPLGFFQNTQREVCKKQWIIV